MSKSNKSNSSNNKQDPKWKIWIESLKLVISFLTVAVTLFGIFYAVPEIINNTNNNKQTQVVIEPRDGDIIVKDGDDYKLLQLINISDIIFPTKIQEIQYNYNDTKQSERVNINNLSNEDWSTRDSFSYVINSFSINPNKVINLLDNIDKITVYCDFYSEKNITTLIDLNDKNFSFTMRESIKDKNFEVTKTTINSDFSYVTKETNDGIEWVKIRVEIVYLIGDREITDTLTSEWIETDADIV